MKSHAGHTFAACGRDVECSAHLDPHILQTNNTLKHNMITPHLKDDPEKHIMPQPPILQDVQSQMCQR